MQKDLEIFEFIETYLKQNQSVVLMVVVESSGSSPGRPGFKMAVAEDAICGSIGGGVMEISLVEQAKLKIKNEELKIKSEIIEQIHRKNVTNSSGMICSGKQKIIYYCLNFKDLQMVRKIIQKTKNNPLDRYLTITSNTFEITWRKFFDVDYKFSKSENDFRYSEKIGFKHKLYIIGGGHCALALSELMSKMDFHISLFDDREDLNTLAKNKFVDTKIILKSYENIGEFIDSDSNGYVVVMTLGYKFDEIVIRQLIDKNYRYFGVLGSKSKMRTLIRNLEKEGLPKEKLAKIHTPIGLPINSHTPEEIAVSIAAEIISVKNMV